MLLTIPESSVSVGSNVYEIFLYQATSESIVVKYRLPANPQAPTLITAQSLFPLRNLVSGFSGVAGNDGSNPVCPALA